MDIVDPFHCHTLSFLSQFGKYHWCTGWDFVYHPMYNPHCIHFSNRKSLKKNLHGGRDTKIKKYIFINTVALIECDLPERQ